MISRKTTSILARIFDLVPVENPDSLYGARWNLQILRDLFYNLDYPEWFVNRIGDSESAFELAEFIKGLQTGSSVRKAFFNYKGDSLKEGQDILRKMATDILTMVNADFEAEPNPRDEMENLMRALVRQLELDEYVFRNNKLYPIESSVIDEQREQTYLDVLVDTSNLPDPATIEHHLGLSEEHFVNKKWDDSISNSRKVLDAILSQIATNVYLKVNNKPIPPEMLKNATDVRLFLERVGLLTKQERELLDKLYGLLSTSGGHPFIAEQDQARLLRQQVLTNCQFVLLQYQGFRAANP